ncbi:hypothetical protein L1S35_01415 [Flavobacterium sp. AS60]|uniref:hypothetical protein n=1 Tax=Flavobacterium anseongense TaxID=2910677 RepID=UPI001F2094A7|nr:hypothetical protein [Flavobacterium sp. AS60]MCF6128314.1 hypothetical protein [Flavobacterium sp. AS60]
MKKLFFILFTGVFTFSCSSDDSSGPALSDTPLAKVEYDNSNFGIYKGVFIGSSGTVLININNDGFLEASLTIDGSTSIYTSTESATLNSAMAGLTFTNGSNSFDFSVTANGGDPTVSNINISGHPDATIVVLKEFHNVLAKCYVGSFSGDDSGLFHVVIVDAVVDGIARSNDGGSAFNTDGTLIGTTITGTFEGGTFTGTSSGNRISGSWQNSFGESGTWSGTRKL